MIQLAGRVGRRARWHYEWLFRYATAVFRTLPTFIIIGVQKGGTTSLYNYLVQHPAVLPAFRKEIHFFDVNFHKGVYWYRTYFPASWEMKDGAHAGSPYAIGEASPYYIFHPDAPERLFSLLPNARLIVMLRNPVDRAYSHYQHEARRGRETLPFAAALEQEAIRLQDEKFRGYNHRRFSYLSRGVYVAQLGAWFRFFPRDQFLIIKSESFYQEPTAVWEQVLNHLQLPAWHPPSFPVFNLATYSPMDATMRSHLLDYFAPYNQQLSELLQVDFCWN